ncbi:MAG: GDSL-type esterase/lipase family protein [Chthoniobacteraceae bacterium]
MKAAACLLLAIAPFLVAAGPSLELTVPPRWYAVPGVPMSLYYDNIVLTETPGDYRFEINCDIGKAEARRWTVTPADKDAGDHPMRITVKDATGKVLEQAQTVLHVARRDAGAKRTLRLLIVGDSLTHATLYPNEIARLLGEPGNPKWTMLGTHKPAAAKPGVAHEGYGGWKWSDFLTKFDPKPAGVTAGPPARKSTSPFIYADAAGKGTLDIPRYIREECGGQPPDVVTFLLGINDCFGAKPDDREAMGRTIDAVLDHADKLLAAFHAAAPRAILAVGLTTPPNSREEAFVANYKNAYHRWGWKRIQHRLIQRMQQRLAGREAEGIHLVPTTLNLDPIDGYPPNNGVHPNAAGYAQIAASFHAWLKTWMEK